MSVGGVGIECGLTVEIGDTIVRDVDRTPCIGGVLRKGCFGVPGSVE